MTIRRLDDSRNLVSYERCPPPPPPRQSQVPSLSTNRISNSEVEEPLIYPPDLGYFGSQNDFRVQKFSFVSRNVFIQFFVHPSVCLSTHPFTCQSPLHSLTSLVCEEKGEWS
ncbi:hypothetical protein TSMEX_011372 [Taenia solium]|eukprot:TsM_001191100 transcript=TsM_001191100 gene=TsM_001191100